MGFACSTWPCAVQVHRQVQDCHKACGPLACESKVKSPHSLDPQNQKFTMANLSISQCGGHIAKLPIPLQLQDTGEGVVAGWRMMASVR